METEKLTYNQIHFPSAFPVEYEEFEEEREVIDYDEEE